MDRDHGSIFNPNLHLQDQRSWFKKTALIPPEKSVKKVHVRIELAHSKYVNQQTIQSKNKIKG